MSMSYEEQYDELVRKTSALEEKKALAIGRFIIAFSDMDYSLRHICAKHLHEPTYDDAMVMQEHVDTLKRY
jgi:hypothetical protein